MFDNCSEVISLVPICLGEFQTAKQTYVVLELLASKRLYQIDKTTIRPIATIGAISGARICVIDRGGWVVTYYPRLY